MTDTRKDALLRFGEMLAAILQGICALAGIVTLLLSLIGGIACHRASILSNFDMSRNVLIVN